MSDDTNIHQNWRELCEAAAKEHDPEKLRELVRKINEALAPKIRSRITPCHDVSPQRDEKKETSSVGLNDLLSLGKLCTAFAQKYLPNLDRPSRAFNRLSAWNGRAKVVSSSMCAPLRAIH
ncbi:MAG: hypothetical protein ABSE92_03840 [Terriglobales bacterium]|jgi:hypothetical protein